MWEFGGIVRNGNLLKEGIKKLEGLKVKLETLKAETGSK